MPPHPRHARARYELRRCVVARDVVGRRRGSPALRLRHDRAHGHGGARRRLTPVHREQRRPGDARRDAARLGTASARRPRRRARLRPRAHTARAGGGGAGRCPGRVLRRCAGRSRQARCGRPRTLPGTPDRLRVVTAVPEVHPGRGRGDRGRHQPVRGSHPLRGARLSETGSLDGGPSLEGERRHARRRRRLRLPGRQQGAGAALDAGPGSGMALPPGLRATAALVALSVAQPAVRRAVRSATIEASRIEASLAFIISGGNAMKKVLVTGAGGFIGHHLTKFLVERGYWVRGVDVKLPEYEATAAHEFELLDLRRWDNCLTATRGVDEVYALAANMGGIGFIHSHKAEISRDNVLINIHTLDAARVHGVSRLLYTSSACVSPGYLQDKPDVTPLKEEDAYPADPEDGYGWEKLYTERVCRHYTEDYGLETRTVRFHNIFGPLGTYDGGREKSPAAICRKVALAKDEDVIDVWGDGKQTRSYCYIDDCVEGIYRLMRSD